MKSENFTAYDLLFQLLDYKYLYSSEWVRDSPPSVARRTQLLSLLHAFGLTKEQRNPLENPTEQIDYVWQGDFLRNKMAEANKEITDRVIAWMSATLPERMDLIANGRRIDINWLFNNLLHFRLDIYKTAYPDSGMLEGFSAGLYYSHSLKRQLKDIITNNLTEIDETLTLMLDPERRVFTKAEINYPDADLDTIDRKWRIENY